MGRSKHARRSGVGIAIVLALGATCEPTRHSRAEDPAPTPPTTVVATEPARFDPAIARLGASVEQAATAIAAGDLAAVDPILARADAVDAGVIRYRLATAHATRSEPELAIGIFQAVIDAQHPLALASRIEVARLAADPIAARAAVEPACTADWPGRAEACTVLALTSVGAADARERIDAALATSTVGFDDRVALVLALTPLLEAGDDADRERAIELLRSLGDLRPTSSVVADADARAVTIADTLAADAARRLRPLGTTHALARAEALARSNAHADAQRAFHAIAAHTRATEPAHCAALFGEGRSMYRARERAQAAAHLDEVTEQCARDAEVVASSLYFAAKSYVALGHDDTAIARFDALAEHAPDHHLADDARYEAAAIEIRNGAFDAARAHLRAIIDGPVEADMRPDTLFLLGWTERRAGSLDAALAAFDEAIAAGAPESREDVGGRIAYWRARTLAELGRADEARAAFEALATSRPLSYYGRHARGRLAETGTSIADAAVEEVALTFERSPVLETDGFERVVACLRAGEVALAERELDAIGLTSTHASDENRWLAVALLSEAGASERAVSRTRGTLVRGLLGSPLDAEARARFALAYPRGYADIVRTDSADASIPSALVFGLIREESSFAPNAVSIAHAYGLMQLIRPTAARLARPLGLRSDVASLVTPETNVRLGTRYLGELDAHYAGGSAVVPAAYNAGQGAVDRWLRERGELTLDEFVETIPYAETRGYTRRVLQSWGVYAYLETGHIEPLGTALPSL
jgi:soluble lytic murein transglycosylase